MGIRTQIKTLENTPKKRITKSKDSNLKKKAKEAVKKYDYPILSDGLQAKLTLIDEEKTLEPCDTLIITLSQGITPKNIIKVDNFLPKETKIDIIAIHDFSAIYDPNIKDKLHPDILDCIYKLRVKRILLLLNSDTLTVQWKKDVNTDIIPRWLAKEIYTFSANLQPLKEDRNNQLNQIVFSHILTNYNTKEVQDISKIIKNYPKESSTILEELKEPIMARRFFNSNDISNAYKDKIARYFGLENEQEFYKTYKKNIGVKEFVFSNFKCQYDNERREVVFLQHKDVDKFAKVAGNYMKFVLKAIQAHNGKTIPAIDLVKYPVGEIIREYGKDFVKNIPLYDGLTLKPSNTKEYERVVKVEGFGFSSKLLNMYEPIAWDEKEGEITYTLKYLKHVFGGEATVNNSITGDSFTMVLDYLSILYRYPHLRLPAIMLVSKEQGTGKTSFGNLLTNIFGNNAVSLKINDFLSDFNMLHAFKFITIIDEGTLDLDKNHAKNVIKNLTTAENTIATPKGIDSQQFPNYKKLLIFNNEPEKPMKLEEDDTRFWVIKVPVIPKDQKDPELLKKMREEIPALLHFLGTREIHHPMKTRFWFEDDIIRGERGKSQFWKIVEATMPAHHVEIENLIRSYFIEYKLNELRIDAKNIIEGISKTNKYRVSGVQIKEFFKDKNIKTEPNPSRLRIPENLNENNEIEYLKDKKGALPYGRYFKLLPQDWLSKKELEEHAKGFDTAISYDYDPTKKLPEITEDNMIDQLHNYLAVIKDPVNLKSEALINGFNEKYKSHLLNPKNFKEGVQLYIDNATESGYKGKVYHWNIEPNKDWTILNFKHPF